MRGIVFFVGLTFQLAGYLSGLSAGIAMWWFYMGSLIYWLGPTVGLTLAIVIAPGAILYPFIFWGVEGIFPWAHFLIWAGGLVGACLGYIVGGALMDAVGGAPWA